MPGERLEIELQGGHRGLELMSEVADEGVLQAVELQGFQVVNEDDEDPRQDDADQERQAENHHPGFSLQELAGIELVILDDRFELFAYADIPVDVQKEGNRKGDSGENKDENR